jgi:tetratricopeptide (TPR) repeat protein
LNPFRGVTAISPEKSPEAAEYRAEAVELFQQAFKCQAQGELRRALNLYQRSIELYPSAEAHTFLGWTYSFMGRLENAISHCRKAIEIDPDFGNPYNDIGAYLIELGRHDEALPWLERAARAKRYDCPQYPWFNMGRIYEAKRKYAAAKMCYMRSMAACPGYPLARQALLRIVAMFN